MRLNRNLTITSGRLLLVAGSTSGGGDISTPASTKLATKLGSLSQIGAAPVAMK